MQTRETKTFFQLFSYLELMGFKRGVTYQSLPYNFTKSYRNNELHKYFKSNILRLTTLTGKKNILVGHSLGNLNIMYQLSKLSQKFKDKYIHSWTALAPPFLGSAEPSKIAIGGYDEFAYFGHFGITYETAVIGFSSFASLYELMLKNMYKLYENEEWFKWVENRIDHEKGLIKHKDTYIEQYI